MNVKSSIISIHYLFSRILLTLFISALPDCVGFCKMSNGRGIRMTRVQFYLLSCTRLIFPCSCLSPFIFCKFSLFVCIVWVCVCVWFKLPQRQNCFCKILTLMVHIAKLKGYLFFPICWGKLCGRYINNIKCCWRKWESIMYSMYLMLCITYTRSFFLDWIFQFLLFQLKINK